MRTDDLALSVAARRRLWFAVGIVMAALVGINVLTWWIELTIDPAPVVAIEPGLEIMFRYFGPELTGDSIGFGATVVIGAFVHARDRTNRFAWAFGTFSLFWVVGTALTAMAVASFDGRWPSAWAPWLASAGAASMMIFTIGTVLVVALFPTGSFPDGWMRPVFRVGFALAGLVAILRSLAPTIPSALDEPWTTPNPFAVSALSWFDPAWGDIVFTPVMLLAIVSLVVRFRSSGPEVRLQIKWVATGMVVMTLTAATMSVIDTPWEGYPVLAALWFTVAAVGVAITKHRLYEIDVVISRSLVFLTLAGFITLLYTGIVVGVGSLLGGSSVGWSIAATALVAVAFEPVRTRVQKWVNRLVYGQRATPYEVLSDLTGRLAATESEDGLLDRMATRLAQGTGSDRAVVWVWEDGVLRAAACEPATERPVEAVASMGELPGTTRSIEHDGDLLGAISVESRRGETLTPTETRLVDDLAGSAGLLMRRLRLERDLERKAEELELSRRRLVDAQDVERRRLESELNDGAQQQVVALKLQLGIAEQRARAEGSEKVATLIAQMAGETQDALDQITALANGIYPPLLEAEGLAVAVTALTDRAPVDVTVEVDMHHRHPVATEAAVYFTISEAITNAVKHGVAPLCVRLSDSADDITFAVTDSGPGFDPTVVKRGSGLDNMGDRLEALGGSVEIVSSPGDRTTVSGNVPVSLVPVG